MLDIKLLRSDEKRVKEALRMRKTDCDIDGILNLDKKRREKLFEVEQLKNKQNTESKLIPEYKKQGKDISSIMQKMKELSENIKRIDCDIREIEEEMKEKELLLPNIPNSSVPEGYSEKENIEIRKWGEPKKFNFVPEPHWELAKKQDILDFSMAAKVTGARFAFYKNLGARLERALINFMLDMHIERHGYVEVMPPYIVNKASMTGTGQLPKFEEDSFKLEGSEYYLIPTAEVPVTNMYREQILDIKELPIKHVAYTACFRAEAGAAGKDTRGLIRQHQFNKVELVKFTEPETSYKELEKLTNDAENILKALELPYRVVKLCTGDLGFASAMTYDIEVWMPSYNKYVEISSCSNYESFQARRAGIKFRREPEEKPEYVHTLNGSGLAAGRTTAAVLENFQEKDGSVIIPGPLRKYMNNESIIKLEK